MIVRNPIEKYRMAKGDKGNIVAPPTVTEVERILSVAEPHLTRAIMIGFRCGLRPGGGGIAGLMWSDYDSERQMLRVVSSRKGLQAVRFVPVPDDLASLLCGWNLGDKSRFGRSDMPIVHFRGESVASLKRTWRRAKELAKVTRELRLYDLRHAMATAIIQGWRRHRNSEHRSSGTAGRTRPPGITCMWAWSSIGKPDRHGAEAVRCLTQCHQTA